MRIVTDAIHSQGLRIVRLLNACLFVIFTLVSAPAQSTPAYTFTSFDVPGATLTHVNGINARGDIVGWYLDGSGQQHGFVRDQSGFSAIDFPGSLGTIA